MLITKGTALSGIGRVREGIGVIETGESIARSAGLISTLLRGLNNRSIPQGDFDLPATLAAGDEALVLARRMGLRHWILSFSASVGFANIRLGDWDRAVAVLELALADDPAAEDRIGLLGTALMASAYRGEDVAGLLAEIERLMGASTDKGMLGNLYNSRGIAALVAGDLVEAQAQFHQAAENDPADTDAGSDAAHAALWRGDLEGAAAELEALDESGFRTPAAEARRVTIRAGLAAGEGRLPEALGLYRDALRRWRDLRFVVDETLCVIDMVTLLDPAEPDVRAAAEAAREILVRLKAKPLLERLDAAMEKKPARTPASSAKGTAALRA